MDNDWDSKAKSSIYAVDNFRFHDGPQIPVRLAYHTLGSLNAAADNAVMLLHGTTGSGRQFLQPSMADFLFGKDQPLDVTQFFVIMPDAIGHGESSRPSEGLGPEFPRYGYSDIVEGQRRLLTEELGIERLRLLLGTSMGGMQTWMWGQRYPEQQALMAIASLPERITGRNLLWRRMLIRLIQSDPGYAGGRYDEQPPGVGHAMALFSLMTGSARHMASDLRSTAAADSGIQETESRAMNSEDANDLIWEFDASRDYDPAPGLKEIRAPLLAVNFEDDELNPIELGGLERAIAEVARGRATTLPAGSQTRGHQTLRFAEVWCDSLAEWLSQTQ